MLNYLKKLNQYLDNKIFIDMKADTFVKLLRKVIREEVQAVVREELGILLEAPKPKPVVAEARQTTVKNSMVESIKPAKPTQPIKPTAFTNNNILNEILNETKHASDWQSLGTMDSSMAQGFGRPMMNEVQVVNSVDQMLSSTRPAGDINAVKIDVVPDFSALMNKMKQDGKL
jgi:hypothetical protein